MQQPLIVLFGMAVLFSAHLAAASDYKPQVSNCRASLEQWLAREAGSGKKILKAQGGVGAFQEYLIRWNSGTVQEVTVGPTIGPDGAPAVCILASRYIRKDHVAAATQ